MKIPIPVTHQQPWLFDLPITNAAQVRNIVGDLAERLTAMLVKGVRFKTNSQCQYCPDVYAKGVYIESKAVGRTKEIFIYEGRLEKDKEFAATRKLIYCIWHHLTETKYCTTKAELLTDVLTNMQCVYLIPFASIRSICRDRPVEVLNTKYKNRRTYGAPDSPMYGSGYRMQIKLLSDYPHVRIPWQMIQAPMVQKILVLNDG